MVGFTDFGCGMIREQIVAIPFDVIVQIDIRKIQRKYQDWMTLLASTGQPDFLSPENFDYALRVEREERIEFKSKVNDLKVRIALGCGLNQAVNEEVKLQTKRLLRTFTMQ